MSNHKQKKKKLTKEEKAARLEFRQQVVECLQLLRRAPVEGGEKRYLLKKDFVPNKTYQEVVEHLSDFIEARSFGVSGLFEMGEGETPAARALWYSFSLWVPDAEKKKKPKNDKTKEGEKFDPHGEDAAFFDIDIRSAVTNVLIAAQALVIYLAESETELFRQPIYDAFLVSFGSAKDDAAKSAAISQLLRGCPALTVNIVHRVTTLVSKVAREALNGPQDALPGLASALGPALFRFAGASEEQDRNTRTVRQDALQFLANHIDLLPKDYVATASRLGQALHLNVEPLRENENQILLNGAESFRYKQDQVVVEAGERQTALYRVQEGTFSVYVGEVKVATLIKLDWFGEAAFLGNSFARARVVADRKGGVCLKLPYGKLDAVLTARPDLARKFYSLLAVEEASRINIAMIQLSNADQQKAVDPMSGAHPMHLTMQPREQVKGESKFVYQAEMHAVRSWEVIQKPKKASKKERSGTLYIFPSQVVLVYRKGHSEKKLIVKYDQIKSFIGEEAGSKLSLVFADGKKEHSKTLFAVSAAEAKKVLEVYELLRKSQAGGAGAAGEAKAVSCRALFSFKGSNRNELSFNVGDKLTILDLNVGGGDWYYGVNPATQATGIFPAVYVDPSPPGVLLSGVLTPADWQALDDKMAHLDLKKGDVVVQEGDAVRAGDFFFLAEGSLFATKTRANGMKDEFGAADAGETFGELLFLLGGRPRATISVRSDSAVVLQLPRAKLLELVREPEFGAKFYKSLCAALSSRLSRIQARLQRVPPPLPAPVTFVQAPQELAKADSFRAPSLPDLPPPPVDPKEELLEKIKRQGFFLGVDAPADKVEAE